MDRITPTGWGQQKGEPVQQLGSLDAVIRALPAGSVVIIGHLASCADVGNILSALGRPRTDIRCLSAAGGPNMLYELPRQTPVGIDVDAFAGIDRAMWADMQRILSSRFETVLWA